MKKSNERNGDCFSQSADQSDILTRIEKAKAITDELFQELEIAKIAKDFNISKKIVSARVFGRSITVDKAVKTEQLSAYYPGLVDVVVDCEGKRYFLENDTESGKFIFSESKLINSEKFIPPTCKKDYYLPSLENIRKYEGFEGQGLFNAILEYLDRQAHLTLEQKVVMASFILSSYLFDHPDVGYLPILYLFGPKERGKTRAGKAVIDLCFRGVRKINIKEAHIPRIANADKASILLDISETESTLNKESCKDILLGRFEKGSQLSRCNRPDAGPHRDMDTYDVFGSTIIATNQPVNEFLESRSIQINMEKSEKNFDIYRSEESYFIRDMLTFWRAYAMGIQLPNIEKTVTITSRLYDITKVLFQVCKVMAHEYYGMLVTYIEKVAIENRNYKIFTSEGIILSSLAEMGGLQDGQPFKTENLASICRRKSQDYYKYSSQFVGRFCSSVIGFEQSNRGGISHYRFDRNKFDSLCKEHHMDLTAESELAGEKVEESVEVVSELENPLDAAFPPVNMLEQSECEVGDDEPDSDPGDPEDDEYTSVFDDDDEM